MTLLDYYQEGMIQDLFEKGAITVNVITYFRYNEVYLAYKKRGLGNNKAYEYAADECGCSSQTIRTAVKFVKH